ncbi:MAG: GNAT family N-acetyltransferase [Planctomycetaceae bacterium]|jgi:GNAT superfamily N-acetyltransferase|nr:GNAT family N-acetyltransferase [Planctomycetaceae bacterium]
MTIVQAKTWFQQKAFLDFPQKMYKNDPYWIPQLRIEQSGLAGFKFFGHQDPFYEHNECQAFLAVDGNNVLGRICAILNRGHLERYHDGVGFLGFFDCVENVSVAGELFNAAADWLRERNCTIIRGPINPSLNHTLGLLIDGFNKPPMFMMTYNPPYYEKLFEDNGFRKSQDLYAYWGEIGMLPKVNAKLQPICNQIKERTGATSRSVNTKRFQEDVEMFLNIYNRALTNTWGFVPMSKNEIKEMAFFLKYLIVPELTTAIELDGKMVGASFALPDYNPRIKAIGGRMTPLRLFKLLRHKEKIKSIRILSTNVLPEYQMQGLGMLLMNALVPKVLQSGIREAEFSWVLESNSFSRGALEKGGAIRTKTYRVYDKLIVNSE